MFRQELADALDAQMMKRLLPSSAVTALGDWFTHGPGVRYASGPGAHTADYVPAHWSSISPWPQALGDQARSEVLTVSRSGVTAAVKLAVARERWSEALITPYVWGTGRRIWVRVSHLKQALATSGVEDTVCQAAETLQNRGAVEAYHLLEGALPGLGPAFFTKFLYFLGLASTDAPGPQPLILDSRIAAVLRTHASRIGEDIGMPKVADITNKIWREGGWTHHRYGVYLGWMHAANEQLAASVRGWPASAPDLLELALFTGAWNPEA